MQTQFEAFLSMRTVTVNGLDYTPEEERRCTVVPIHNAPKALTAALVDEWGDKTAKTAYDILKQPDVKVTNQKDKDMQLPKLKKLNAFAKSAVADVATAALPPAPPHARTCQCL